jgi:cell wall-associated NlpC family hydrolase
MRGYNGFTKTTTVNGVPQTTRDFGKMRWTEAFTAILSKGVPVQIALDAMARVYPQQPPPEVLANLLGPLDPGAVQAAAANAKAVQTASGAIDAMNNRVDALFSRTAVGANIAKTALSQLGTPYQYGGPAKLGSRTDCSGLLQASAAANGVHIGRTTYEQWKQGIPVPMDQLQPGDAVFFEMGPRGPGHVAIYIGNGRVVEDPHTGASVEISQLAGRGPVGARRYG